MKIMHFITLSTIGGAQSVVISLANAQVNQGHDVSVVSSPGGGMWDLLDNKVNKIEVNSLVREISPVKDLKASLFLLSKYNKIKPDIVHLHSSKAGLLGRLMLPGKKIIYTVHGFDSMRVRYRKLLFLEKILKYKVKKIVAVSRYDNINLHEEGIKNTEIVYNGISDSLLESNELRKNKDRLSFFTVARLAVPKRFDLFVELAKSFPDCDFYWIGNKKEDETGEIPANIYMLGEIKDVGLKIKCFDYFVLLSDFEGLPVSILEALRASKPVIASNVGGISEIIDDNGYLVENNIESISKAVTSVFKNDSLKDLGDKSRKIFDKKFVDNIMVDQYMEIYSE